MLFARTLACIQLAAILAVGTPSPSSATCGQLSFEDSLKWSKYVFAGKVVKVEIVKSEYGRDTIEATVEVGEIFKGDLETRVKFITQTKRDYLTFEFHVAAEYLFFAGERDGFLVTGPCSRSGLVGVEAVDDDLGRLRAAVRR